MFIANGELSGDIHSAHLISCIYLKNRNVEFFGIGQHNSEKAGCRLIFNSSHWGIVGGVEILKIVPKLYSVLKRLSKILDDEHPDIAILVDYPGFNLKLAQLLKKKKIPIVYYIPPMVFWRKGKKAQKVASLCDKVITIFAQEYQKYKSAGANVYFVGHPLLDIVKCDLSDDEIYNITQLDKSKRTIGLLPGSRLNEVEKILPVMLDSIKILNTKFNDLQFIIPCAVDWLKPIIQKIISQKKIDIPVVENLTYPVMKISELLFVVSGTATLEATIFEKPMIILYKVSKLTEFLAHFVLSEKIIGLPNICAGKLIVPELLQEDVCVDKILKTAEELLTSYEKRNSIIEELKSVKYSLGTSGAAQHAADIILQDL